MWNCETETIYCVYCVLNKKSVSLPNLDTTSPHPVFSRRATRTAWPPCSPSLPPWAWDPPPLFRICSISRWTFHIPVSQSVSQSVSQAFTWYRYHQMPHGTCHMSTNVAQSKWTLISIIKFSVQFFGSPEIQMFVRLSVCLTPPVHLSHHTCPVTRTFSMKYQRSYM